jgi:Domain of unknown function (DUF4263)
MSIKLPRGPVNVDFDEIIANDPLGEFFVWWQAATATAIRALRRCLVKAQTENDLQQFLSEHPLLLATQMGGGHGRWVIPKQRLGCEYVTDFVVGERSSIGFEWHAVALESPKVRMFTKAGNPTKELTHAISQIQRWRAWLQQNQNYASRSRIDSGLGLTDIASNLPGLILIGRRADQTDETNSLRRQMVNDLRIRIHSYDQLFGSGALVNLSKR